MIFEGSMGHFLHIPHILSTSEWLFVNVHGIYPGVETLVAAAEDFGSELEV